MPFSAILWALLLAQSGWALAQSPPREVGRIYWELVPQTEIWLRLIPEDPAAKPPLVNLVFHAFFPGRADRDPYSGLPQWPKGTPARLTISAEPLPMTVIKELKLQLEVDGVVTDLTAHNDRYRTLPFPCVLNCVPNAVEADVDASLVRSIATARSAGGKALGFPIKLVQADQVAVSAFLARVGLAESSPGSKR